MAGKRARRWLLAGGAAALTVALAAVAWSGAGCGETAAEGVRGPIAVVLAPDVGGSTLIVVDLRAGRVIRRIGLRSTVTDIAVEPSSGIVVGAQAGGFGGDVDRAASLTEPRSGTVRYVELSADDPGDVACVEGRALLLHATVEESGAVVSVVDVASARVIATGHVPGPPGLWAAAAGAVWTTGEDAVGEPSLRRIAAGDLSITPFPLGTVLPMGLAETAGRPLVLGSDPAADASSSGVAALVDPGRGVLVPASLVAGPSSAPSRAVQVGGRLVVGDWNGDEPESRALRLLDAVTLRDLGALPVDGVPCALAAWGERLLIVEREQGRLLVMDPASGRTISSVDLGVPGVVFSDVVVVGEASDG